MYVCVCGSGRYTAAFVVVSDVVGTMLFYTNRMSPLER